MEDASELVRRSRAELEALRRSRAELEARLAVVEGSSERLRADLAAASAVADVLEAGAAAAKASGNLSALDSAREVAKHAREEAARRVLERAGSARAAAAAAERVEKARPPVRPLEEIAGLRQENAMLMEQLVVTKVRMADLEGEFLRSRRELARAVALGSRRAAGGRSRLLRARAPQGKSADGPEDRGNVDRGNIDGSVAHHALEETAQGTEPTQQGHEGTRPPEGADEPSPPSAVAVQVAG